MVETVQPMPDALRVRHPEDWVSVKPMPRTRVAARPAMLIAVRPLRISRVAHHRVREDRTMRTVEVHRACGALTWTQ